jgi:hypothetical protein
MMDIFVVSQVSRRVAYIPNAIGASLGGLFYFAATRSFGKRGLGKPALISTRSGRLRMRRRTYQPAAFGSSAATSAGLSDTPASTKVAMPL